MLGRLDPFTSRQPHSLLEILAALQPRHQCLPKAIVVNAFVEKGIMGFYYET